MTDKFILNFAFFSHDGDLNKSKLKYDSRSGDIYNKYKHFLTSKTHFKGDIKGKYNKIKIPDNIVVNKLLIGYTPQPSGPITQNDTILTAIGKLASRASTITLSGDVVGSGSDIIVTTLTNSAVINQPLTGFIPSSGPILPTDSILTAIEKLSGVGPPNGITSLFGDVVPVTGPGSVTVTLNSVNSTPGTFGDALNIPVVETNNKGLITNMTTIPLTSSNIPNTIVTRDGDGEIYVSDINISNLTTGVLHCNNMSNVNSSLIVNSDIENNAVTLDKFDNTGTLNYILTATGTGSIWKNPNLITVENAVNVTGIVPINNGGTGASSQQDALNTLTGTQINKQYLRSDGTNSSLSFIQIDDVPILNQNTTGNASTATFATSSGNAVDFTGNLVGDITGTQSSTLVSKIQGVPVSNTLPAIGQVLSYDGTKWIAISITDGTVTNISSTDSTISITNPTTTPILTFNGTNITGGSTAKVVYNNQGLVTGSTPLLASDLPTTINSNTTGSSASCTGNAVTATTSISFSGILDGDITGTQLTTLVSKIQGVPISNTLPLTGQALVYDGTKWVATSITNGTVTNITSTNSTISISNPTTTPSLTFNGTQITPGTFPKVTYNSQGLITGGTTLTAGDIPTPINSDTTGNALTSSSCTGNAVNVTGIVAISNGGTGANSQQAALNALTGSQTNGKYLRSDGTNTSLSSISASDVPILNQNTTGNALTSSSCTGNAANVTGIVAIINGGTNAITAIAGFNNLSPMLNLGDLIYQATGTAARLAGNTTTTKKFLTQTGDGTNSATPIWNAITAGDVPILNQNTTGNAGNVTGIVAIINGGTGASTQQTAINNLVGTQANTQYLRSNGTNVSMSGIQIGDVPTLNQDTTGTATNAINLTGSGTISSTTTATTASANTSNTTVATTAYVDTQINALRKIVHTLFTTYCNFPNGLAAGTYFTLPQNSNTTPVPTNSTNNAISPVIWCYDSTKYQTVNGVVPYFNLSTILETNASQPMAGSGIFSIGLAPITRPSAASGNAGGQLQMVYTVGSQVSGTTTSYTNTAAAMQLKQDVTFSSALLTSGAFYTITISSSLVITGFGYAEIQSTLEAVNHTSV